MKAKLKFHSYKYFAYEKELAKEEVETLLGGVVLEESGAEIVADIKYPEMVDRLVYFEKVEFGDECIETWQSRLERSCPKTGGMKRQSTRYSAHGLHEYKGKFNPQIVGAIKNILNIKKSDFVLDPFGGSGTTITECALHGINAFGTDINPLAVKIANAKMLALGTHSTILHEVLDEVVVTYRSKVRKAQNTTHEDLSYLSKWFPKDKLYEILTLKDAIVDVAGDLSDIFLCIGSDLLREHSYQDPADLRIRRRKTPVSESFIIDDFYLRSSSFIKSLGESQSLAGVIDSKNKEHLLDSQKGFGEDFLNKCCPDRFDALITSPPYATALPYIDSQRLSLVWMGLSESSRLFELESSLIGSRELRGRSGQTWSESMLDNSYGLPDEIAGLCLKLKTALSPTDGFRRKAVPALLYRYFSGMKANFINCSSVAKPNAPYALVVGQNATKIGGERTIIDTPGLLGLLAKDSGWLLERIQPLNTYHRFGLHQSNSIKKESLVVLRKA